MVIPTPGDRPKFVSRLKRIALELLAPSSPAHYRTNLSGGSDKPKGTLWLRLHAVTYIPFVSHRLI